MSVKSTLWSGLLLAALVAGSGCQATYGPGQLQGLHTIPIPLSPYFQKLQENRFWEKERYNRVAILGPITSGGPPRALDPPSWDEIVRALPSVEGGIPFLHEVQRNNVRIVIEPMGDSVDPPRFYPMIGWAQLHHAHYKCTIYYTEVTRVGWPIPYTTRDEDASEVIYIDHDHFHLVGNVDGGPTSHYQQHPH